MQKYSIKISLVYCAVFTVLAVLVYLSSIFKINPELFATIANVAWLVIAIKMSNTIKRELIRTKLNIYATLFIAQLVSNILVTIVPLFGVVESILLGIFSGMAIGITVLTMIFFIAQSIKSEKLYMWALKGCLYIIFSVGIIILIAILGNATTNLTVLLQ